MKTLLFLCILFPSIVFADSEIVFTNPAALYLEVQKGATCKKLYTLQTEKLQVMGNIIINLEKENATSTEQLSVLGKKFDLLSGLKTKQDATIDDLTTLIDTQKKGYEEIIKESQPSFWAKVKNNMLWIGIGFILGVVTTIAQ